MHNELYADGIGEITISGSTVRIDLVSLSPTERDASNAPKAVFRQRVVMSLESFANSADLMQQALQGLIDGGAIKRTPGADADQNAQQGEIKAARFGSDKAAQKNGSPNFN